jgi:hypothetical protein
MSSLSGNLQRLNWKCGYRIEHLDRVDISAFPSIGQQNNKYCINVIEEQQKNSIAQHRRNVLEAAYRRKRSH